MKTFSLLWTQGQTDCECLDNSIQNRSLFPKLIPIDFAHSKNVLLSSLTNKNRSKGITSHNVNSTRSHCILQIYIINKETNIKNNNKLTNINLIEDMGKNKIWKIYVSGFSRF